MATTESTQKDAAAEFRTMAPVSKWVALLGRRDEPTDGVGDYCLFLGQALSQRGVRLRHCRVHWTQKGWVSALRSVWVESPSWKNSWILFQYTTMAWSRRGLPFGAWIALKILRWRGLQCAVVFHEASRQAGERLIDHIRGSCQEWVVRRLYSGSNVAIFPDPLDKIEWLPKNASKAVFIPIGANIPKVELSEAEGLESAKALKTVAVFCLSDPPNRHRELGDIAHAMRTVAQQGVKARVVFLGRGTDEARVEIEHLFDSTAMEALNLGLQTAGEVRRILSQADVMLCVRGPLYMRRGSAIAGIACGLPIVGYAGEAEGTPLEEAGVQLVPYLDRVALGHALARVLKDGELRETFRKKMAETYDKHFAWSAVAKRVTDVLDSVQVLR